MRNKTLLFTALSIAMLLTSGCVYRIDIPQGNYVEQKQVEQLRAGMSREQVEFVLGSPMLTDAFDNRTWHYLYYLKPGWEEAQRKTLEAHFANDKLVSISGDFPAPKAFNSGL